MATFCSCGTPVFAGLGGCVEHASGRVLAAEVVRLNAVLSAARSATTERPRFDRDETTILERT